MRRQPFPSASVGRMVHALDALRILSAADGDTDPDADPRPPDTDPANGEGPRPRDATLSECLAARPGLEPTIWMRRHGKACP
jgi:hypothetical protein